MRWGIAIGVVLGLIGTGCGDEANVGGRGSSAAPAATDDVTGTTTGDDEALSPPRKGWRYESYGDIVVEVPASWPYAQAPTTAWCIARSLPDEPYIDTSRPYDGIEDVGCPGMDGPRGLTGVAVPKRHWATHVSFDAPGWQEGSRRDGSWTRTDRVVGSTRVTVLYEDAHADAAARILDSARQVVTDVHGCDATSPIQAGEFARPPVAFDVAEVAAVDAISICQYDLRRGLRAAGLLGSRRLTGAESNGLLDAIKAAPTGGGPDEPQNCSDDMFGSTAVVLRLHHDDSANDLHVYYEWCFGNGFDDGTNIRELTKQNCIPLWAPPVKFDGGSSGPFQRCHEDVVDRDEPAPASTASGG